LLSVVGLPCDLRSTLHLIFVQRCFENPDEVVRKFLALLDHH